MRTQKQAMGYGSQAREARRIAVERAVTAERARCVAVCRGVEASSARTTASGRRWPRSR